MDQFIAKHADKLHGSFSCFDRVVFRGYLPFFSGDAMTSVATPRSAKFNNARDNSVTWKKARQGGFSVTADLVPCRS